MMINPENPVVAKESMGDDIYIAVFANGYVFYKNSRHMTFFPLHSCRDYSEKDVMGEDHVVPFSVFSDQPWQMRVFMEGEKRLVHNANSSRGYAGEISPSLVRIPLRQHIGAPAVCVVSAGARVQRGDVIGEIPEKAMGARIHASISGVVESVADGMVTIKA